MRRATPSLDAQPVDLERITGDRTHLRQARPGRLAAKLRAVPNAWARRLALLGHATLGAGMLATTVLLIRSFEPGPGAALIDSTVMPLAEPAGTHQPPGATLRTVYLVASEADEFALRRDLRATDGIAFGTPIGPFLYDVFIVDAAAEAAGFTITLQVATETLVAFGHADIVIDRRQSGP